MKNASGFALALTCLGLAPATPVLAQNGQPAAATSGPSMILDQNRPDRRAPAPAPKPPAPSGGSAVNAAPAAIAPFTVKAVQLDGSSLSPRFVNPVFRPFVGQRMDGAGLARLTQALSDAYAQSNVALYTIILPNQTFADGVVHLRVVEGYITKVTVKDEGGAKRDLGLVRGYANHTLRERPLRGTTVQRAVLLIRDIPGLTADVQFLRGGGELAIGVKRRAFQLGLGVNDQGTSELGRTQVEADLIANSLIRAGDQTRLTVLVPTDIQRFQYYSLSHSEIVNDSGLTASVNIGYLRTAPKSIPIHGQAEMLAFGLSYPVIRSNIENLSISGSLDGVNSTNALFGQSISDDNTRAVRVAAAYSRVVGPATFAASATGSFGIDAFDAHVTSPYFSNKRFKKLNGRVAIDYRFAKRWTLRLRSVGQLTGDRLPAVEQLPLGGSEFGRGFEGAAVVGDEGVAGSLELAFTPPHLPHLVDGSEVYGFADDGRVWSHDRVIIPATSYALASAGFGVRVAVASKAVVQVEAARALVDTAPQRNDAWRLTLGYRSLY